jgi:excinuclease UvrABC nuclease subunit
MELDSKLYAEDPVAFIKDKRKQMEDAVEALDFETAAIIRDEIYKLDGTDEQKEKIAKKAASAAKPKKPGKARRGR